MSVTAGVSQAPDVLSGLLVPLSDRTLLLPNVAIAELIPYRAPQPEAGRPDWYLGQVAWRDLPLPLLSFEAAAGGEPVVGATPRIAILNALGGRDKVKFIALLIQGIPRSMRVTRDLPSAGRAPGLLELDVVRLGDQDAVIPDLAALEARLGEVGLL